MAIFRRGNPDEHGRRSGPRKEERWWNPDDQRLVERVGPRRGELPKLWKPTSIMNNLEVLDPYEGIEAAVAIVGARAARRRTALVEGEAWRGPARQLLVLRVEAFADEGSDATLHRQAHREAWRCDGQACLLELWRRQWSARDTEPGWIEVRPRADIDVPDSVDWFVVEDHTALRTKADVAVYQHLSVWSGRGAAVVTMRHFIDTPQDEVVRWFGEVVTSGLTASTERPDLLPPRPRQRRRST